MSGASQDNGAREPEARLTGLQRLQTRLLHLYFRLKRGMTLGVRAAVLNDRGEVFLVRHTYTPGWHLPGGGVEVGETMVDALVKELREEACISLTGPAALFGLYFNRRISGRDHVALYVVRNFAVDGDKRPDMEIAEAGWFALAALPQGLTPATRRRLDEIAGGRVVAAEW
ncbi:8-oxo-dGTP pyrophosphatase MutT (NUDIX family) [Bosea sp. OAE506]